MADTPSERRRAVRHVACFPGYVEHGDSDKMVAMIADLGESGTLLLLRQPDLRVDDELRLELHLGLDESAGRIATGRVVRVEPLPDARVSLWTHQVGVEFHDPVALSAAEVESLDKRQAPFGKAR